MITCRTPLRISLFGGGTDFPDWYKYNESLIISGSIDRMRTLIASCLNSLRDIEKILRKKGLIFKS